MELPEPVLVRPVVKLGLSGPPAALVPEPVLVREAPPGRSVSGLELPAHQVSVDQSGYWNLVA
jgi:hypothetical protein